MHGDSNDNEPDENFNPDEGEEWKTSRRRPKKKAPRGPVENKDKTPMPKITSQQTDPYLYKIIMLAYVSFVELKKLPARDLILEESRAAEKFFYHFENKSSGLVGYIGRNKKDNNVCYVVMDSARFKWAILEGFVSPNKHGVLDVAERDLVYKEIGVFREVGGIADFVNFLSKNGEYKFKGEYIKS